ncbi:hypothetical protein Godav_028882 [Gossypium davidsonii]|uniref:Uncharacterized protein n=2 Tax=Gossypium TaxID=3633 RepID=A0A7J8T8I8_GOSDV|nr:hypothetical protein [Gossypium davidsonii]MBA0669446.1 hypothetical protein [Gossypium klotzschianum]
MKNNYDYSAVVFGLSGLVEINSFMKKRKCQELKSQGKLETIFQNLKQRGKKNLLSTLRTVFTRYSKGEGQRFIFDAAFDRQTYRSASGLIVWNEEGEILASQAVHHSNVENPFIA